MHRDMGRPSLAESETLGQNQRLERIGRPGRSWPACTPPPADPAIPRC